MSRDPPVTRQSKNASTRPVSGEGTEGEQLALASSSGATGESLIEFFKHLTLREEQREEKRKAEEVAKEEKRRQEELAREERFQKMMLTMLQTQSEGHQNRVNEREEVRRQEREEQQRLERERHLQEEAREQERLKVEMQRHAELMALERERLETERRQQAAREQIRKEEELKRQQLKEQELRVREAPQMAHMTETDDAELYLSEFEQRMADLHIPQERWMVNLRPLLAHWIKEIVDALPRDQRNNYEVVKQGIMETYSIRKGTIGHRLLTLPRNRGTTFSQWFLTGKRMWRRWTEGCDNEKIGDNFLMELMYNEMPWACRNFCRDKNLKEGRELCALADKFFTDRDSNPDDARWHNRRYNNSWKDQRKEQSGEDPSKNSSTPTSNSDLKNSTKVNRPYRGRDPDWEKNAECYNCKEKGHVSYKCPNKSTPVSNVQLIQNLPFVEGTVNGKQNKLLLDSGAAMSLVHPELVQKEQLTGDTRSVKGATGQEKVYPLAKVKVEIGSFSDQVTAGVTDDTDWVLIGPDFQPFWGVMKEEADKRWTTPPEAETEQISAISTRAQMAARQLQEQDDDEESSASGATPAHLFLNDFDDSICAPPGKDKHKLSKMQKRANTAARPNTNQLQKTIASFTSKELAAAQEADESLATLWELAKEGDQNYWMKDSILYHSSEDQLGEMLTQVVVPKPYRNQVISMAHNSLTAAHLGVKKTCQKILRDFYWPGLTADVKAICHCCEECQKGAKKNRSKAPLMPLPIISEPFQRIAVDIVGPLRRTKRGNKYILTLMDFTTRYPEAIPLRKIDASTVADVLCEVFTRLGIPDEILTDQGTNFLSNLMKKVMETLQVKQIKTSPYHPQCDGMLERFHSTLKSMMRKTCKADKEWDLYLPYTCFAFRDSVHSATGFTPFQLLFGREVRGPLSLLKQQLTGEVTGSRTVVEYVDDLKKKLKAAWEQANENESKAKKASKDYYDQTAKARHFKVGDQVLVLIPDDLDKFQAQWSGPHTVEEQVSDVTYRIATPDRRKKSRLFHTNMIKAWTTPATIMAVQCVTEDENGAKEELPIYTLETGQKDQPNVNPHLTKEQHHQIEDLLKELDEDFSNQPGFTTEVTHSIRTGDSPSVYQRPYRIPMAWQEQVREEVKSMLDAGIIVPSESSWTSPVIPVKKKDGGMRLCIDYRRLNSVTCEDKYQMPRVDELVERLGKAEFITTVDLTKGYYQVPLAPEDRQKSAFVTPMGKFEYTRMPFGLKGAPTTFQRLMDKILSPCHPYSSSYIDDIVIFSKTWQEHLEHIREVFARLRAAGLKAKPRKCFFGMFECDYLGHTVGRSKVRPDDIKINAIRNFQTPRTKKDVRAFVGLTGYYRRFIPQFAALSARMTDLTKKDLHNKVTWTAQLEEDFRKLKELLTVKPILQCPDYDQPFLLQTDASERGIGAVLSQRDENDQEHPVAYYSRKLLPREQRYSTVEKECLGIINALKHFDVYLLGRHFTVLTDHRALKYLHKMKNANSRLTRWALAVQPFSFDILHKPGSQNGNADGLSRQAWEVDGEDLPL